MWSGRLLSYWDPYGDYLFIFPSESHLSLFHSAYLHIPGSSSIKEAFGCIPKLAGSLFLLLSQRSSFSSHPHNSKCKSNQSATELRPPTSRSVGLSRSPSSFIPTSKSTTQYVEKIVGIAARHLWSEFKHFQPFPMLSVAAAAVPPFDNLCDWFTHGNFFFGAHSRSSRILVIPLESTGERRKNEVSLTNCGDETEGCLNIPLLSRSWMDAADIVEPQTGIKFPLVLDKGSTDSNGSRNVSEVLVGMGSRSIKVVRVKSLKVYAFGLYVHPGSVCKKLGQKYKSMPADELKGREEFLHDLLREDIDMTVRLVVNYKGLKINTVRDVFERSLRTRLLKVNPNADSDCLRVFGSYFSHDIPLSVGTTIDFRRTADGQLIIEIGGKQIGAVQSRDLCRAFFDMYIGDVPVSVDTKQEIGENVADLIRRC